MGEISTLIHLLPRIEEKPKTIWVLRHAHREAIQQGTFGNDIPLNLEGREACFSLGRLIRDVAIGEIHTSPILRCVQTAEEIVKGANQKTDIFLSKVLGDPGIFVQEPEKTGSLFLQKSLREIGEKIVNGEKLAGIRSLDEGGRIFLDYISRLKRFPCLMISHDIIICLLCCFFFKSKEVDKYMPNFLEGFSITIHPEILSIHWGKKEAHLNKLEF